MAQLYRKSALERLSSPEQLDKALKVSSPFSWLVLIGIAVIIAVTVVWSIVGTIPVTVTAPGTVVSYTGTLAVYAKDPGIVKRILVKEGDTVHMGDPIIAYTQHGGGDELQYVFVDQFGTVASVNVESGKEMIPGNEVVRISPYIKDGQDIKGKVALCFISTADAKKVKPGDMVNVYLSGIDSQTYGYIIGRVRGIDSHAATNDGMKKTLGSDNLISDYLKNGSVVAFVCEFYPAANGKENGTEKNPYFWTNEKGKTQSVDLGASVNAKVVVEELPPIQKLFHKIKEIWSGGKSGGQ